MTTYMLRLKTYDVAVDIIFHNFKNSTVDINTFFLLFWRTIATAYIST